MPEEAILQALQRIQKTQNTIAISAAIIMGILLIVYFFTFAMLIDKGYYTILWIQAVTSILFITAFFFLNRLAFRVTRLIYGRRQPFASLLARLSPQDASLPPQKLVQRLRELEENVRDA